MKFDPDALLAALPYRQISPSTGLRLQPSRITRNDTSALGQDGEYNGFTDRERTRTAEVSKRLIAAGATTRHAICDICGNAAQDEHAENYYDLSRWIGMCKTCHRNALHMRFANPAKWEALLDRQGKPVGHWSRLVSPQPFDLAALLRSRGNREPTLHDFTE